MKTGETTQALFDYLMWTGALGGGAGGLLGAYSEEQAGGTPEQANEAAIGGAKAGAALGPLAALSVPMTMALGPVGASPIVPWALNVGSESEKPRRERERKAQEEESIRRAIQQRLAEMHRYG